MRYSLAPAICSRLAQLNSTSAACSWVTTGLLLMIFKSSLLISLLSFATVSLSSLNYTQARSCTNPCSNYTRKSPKCQEPRGQNQQPETPLPPGGRGL